MQVSTSEQSYENQVPDLAVLGKATGFEVVATHAEKVSAVKQRPELERLLADARRAKFQVVLLWSLDPLQRNIMGGL